MHCNKQIAMDAAILLGTYLRGGPIPLEFLSPASGGAGFMSPMSAQTMDNSMFNRDTPVVSPAVTAANINRNVKTPLRKLLLHHTQLTDDGCIAIVSGKSLSYLLSSCPVLVVFTKSLMDFLSQNMNGITGFLVFICFIVLCLCST